jgi:pimeloyl-ACP methyl ester carboxylesterase
MHPYDRKSDTPDGILKLLRQGLDAYVAAMTKLLGSDMSSEVKDRMLSTDIEALIAMRVGGGLFDGFEDILSSVSTPCLLFAGEEDGNCTDARRASELIPNATFVSLPGLNHREALMRNDLVLPHITRFLAELGQD